MAKEKSTDEKERSIPREKGVQTMPCPTCGAELAVAEEYEDGGVSLADCTTCTPTETEKASDSETPARETGTPKAQTNKKE